MSGDSHEVEAENPVRFTIKFLIKVLFPRSVQ
jgi:hypothetical protein